MSVLVPRDRPGAVGVAPRAYWFRVTADRPLTAGPYAGTSFNTKTEA